MRYVPVVIRTDHFHDVVLRPLKVESDGPRLCVEDRIIVSRGKRHRVRTCFFKNLGQVQLVAVLLTRSEQPTPLADSGRVNNELVAFVSANRVSPPCSVHIFWMTASVGENAM